MSKSFQYISYRKKNTTLQNVVFSSFSMPESLDAYDITIIEFYDYSIWAFNGNSTNAVNCIQDIRNIRTMLRGSNHTKILVLFPCNATLYYNKKGDSFFSSIELKNSISTFQQLIGQELLPVPYNTFPDFVFENTKTKIGEELVSSNFYIVSPTSDTLSQSIGSNKTTTCRINKRVIISTLIFNDPAKAVSYAEHLFFQDNAEQPPEWMESVSFGSDDEQHKIIEKKEAEIKQCQLQIALAQAKLEKNDYYKSILFSTGDQLVEVVYDMLQRLLDYDLSEFKDVKNEDFRIKKETVTFIGEIKGVGSNVKNEHISQVQHHVATYMDELQEKGVRENIKPLLIINPQRTKPLAERDAIHEDQLKYAKHNDCLIVKTEVLLRIFEAFQSGTINTQLVVECFTNISGELTQDMILLPEGSKYIISD